MFFRLKMNLIADASNINITERIEALLKTVQLQDARHVLSSNLSGGMRRRLSIALALVSPTDSSIVILDEPTTGLDAMVRDQVWQLIKRLRQNRCIVMTT